MFKKLSLLAPFVILLSSWSWFDSAPSKEDVEHVFGFKVRDNACVEAVGKPGYMCTFTTEPEHWSITRRLIKTDSGWKAVDGN